MNIDELYMQRCIQLAKNGQPHTAPNPMVGAVIVADGRIIGEGFHQKVGEAHAEVNAIKSVVPADRELLNGATIYVSLEPCSHYGRTPPCALLIIRSGISRVVIGCKDPFERVSGNGISMLKEAGIEVVVGVLEKECRQLNRRFMLYHTLHRPYITLKWASSKDGFLDRWRREEEDWQPAAKLSSDLTQICVHHQRTVHEAIVVGRRTLLLDRPSLTARAWFGNSPIAVVLGKVAEGELPRGWQCYGDIDTLLISLFEQGIQGVMVEGGLHTLQSFIDKGMWDEAWEESSLISLGEGVPTPHMPKGVNREIVCKMGGDFIHWIR